MSVCCIEIQEGYKIADSKERVDALREILPHLPEVTWNALSDGSNLAAVDKWEFVKALEDCVVDILVTGPLLVAGGFKFTVKAFRSNYLAILTREVAKLTEDFKLVRRMVYNPDTQMLVQVHVPNGFLHEVNEVQVVEDICTDVLQGQLNDGWRILAVCPSIDQRRPDYILGRVKPK